MFKSVRRAVVQGVEKTWHTFASHGEGRGENEWDNETSRYKMEIMMAARTLNCSSDPELVTEAISKIGHLSFSGGPDAAKCAAIYLDALIIYLADRETHMMVRTQVLRTLTEIYRGHRDHGEKFRKLGVLSIIAELMRNYSDPALLRWCCYALFTMCAGSLRNVSMVEAHNLRDNLEILVSLSWKGWPRNYGQAMMLILGYAKEEDFGKDGDDEDQRLTSENMAGHMRDIIKKKQSIAPE